MLNGPPGRGRAWQPSELDPLGASACPQIPHFTGELPGLALSPLRAVGPERPLVCRSHICPCLREKTQLHLLWE